MIFDKELTIYDSNILLIKEIKEIKNFMWKEIFLSH